MNTIPMEVLQRALAALTLARKATASGNVPAGMYSDLLDAEVSLQIALECMADVEVTS